MSKELNETKAMVSEQTKHMLEEHDRFLKILVHHEEGEDMKGDLRERINTFRGHYLAGLQRLASGMPYVDVLSPREDQPWDGLLHCLEKERNGHLVPSLRTLPPVIWDIIAKAMATWCSTVIQDEYGSEPEFPLQEFIETLVEDAAPKAVETMELVED
tara:strand:+ start:548 stop:1021 length:474 start_codon:yes stop_codon:yes gene_type:complete